MTLRVTLVVGMLFNSMNCEKLGIKSGIYFLQCIIECDLCHSEGCISLSPLLSYEQTCSGVPSMAHHA